MSPTARRYFGCVLPVLLAVFGCGTLLLVGYASQVAIQLRRIPDTSMEPVLTRGLTALVNNMAYWTDEPALGDVVTVGHERGLEMRRIVAVPGESIEVRDDVILVDGAPRDPGYTPRGSGPDVPPVTLGEDEFFVLADDRSAEDSRTWGPIARDDIIGLVIFQIDEDRTFIEVLVTPTPAAGSD